LRYNSSEASHVAWLGRVQGKINSPLSLRMLWQADRHYLQGRKVKLVITMIEWTWTWTLCVYFRNECYNTRRPEVPEFKHNKFNIKLSTEDIPQLQTPRLLGFSSSTSNRVLHDRSSRALFLCGDSPRKPQRPEGRIWNLRAVTSNEGRQGFSGSRSFAKLIQSKYNENPLA